MKVVSRRRLLRSGGVGLGIGLAGCAELSRKHESNETSIDRLLVDNWDLSAHTVHVLLLDGSDPVYWKSIRAGAYDPETKRAGGSVLDGYPTKPGSYVLYARLDSQPKSEWAKFDFGNYDFSCVSLSVRVEQLKKGTSNIEILHSVGCE